MPSGTETVRVPHTWNIGRYDDYEGMAWYFRTFALPPSVASQHVELHFEATFYKSRVWLNGHAIGEHEGGYTPYWFDISSFLQPGDNFLAVELDNRPTAESIPGLALKLQGPNFWYDWWHYGGLVRDVWLTIHSTGLIRCQRITTLLEPDATETTSKVLVENVAPSFRLFGVAATIYSPQGDVVARVKPVSVRAAASAFVFAELNATIPKPQLTDLNHPVLYRMELEHRDASGRAIIQPQRASPATRKRIAARRNGGTSRTPMRMARNVDPHAK